MNRVARREPPRLKTPVIKYCRILLSLPLKPLQDRLRSGVPDVSEIAFPYCGAIGVLHDLVTCEVIHSVNSGSELALALRMK
jgi:hypothetical protein